MLKQRRNLPLIVRLSNFKWVIQMKFNGFSRTIWRKFAKILLLNFAKGLRNSRKFSQPLRSSILQYSTREPIMPTYEVVIYLAE